MEPEKIGEQGEGATPHDQDVMQVNNAFTPLGSTPSSAVPMPPTPPQQFAQAPQVANDDEKYSHSGWSWAGLFMGPLMLISIRKYRYLLLPLLPLIIIIPLTVYTVFQARPIPPVGLFVWVVGVQGISMIYGIGLAIYFGFKIRELAAESRTFSNKDQYIGYMKAMDHLGKVLMWIILAYIILVAGIFFFTMARIDNSLDDARGARMRSEQRATQAQYQLEPDSYEYGQE